MGQGVSVIDYERDKRTVRCSFLLESIPAVIMLLCGLALSDAVEAQCCAVHIFNAVLMTLAANGFIVFRSLMGILVLACCHVKDPFNVWTLSNCFCFADTLTFFAAVIYGIFALSTQEYSLCLEDS